MHLAIEAEAGELDATVRVPDRFLARLGHPRHADQYCDVARRRRPAERSAMKAAVRDRYGPPEVVSVEEIERPEAGDGQVLVRVAAASVNRADLDLLYPRPAITRLFIGVRRPRGRRLGCDVAGVVEAVGPGATRFRAGDRVFADMYPYGLGSFGEYVSAPEAAFAPVPEGMSLEDAATLPHAATLAIQSLRLPDGRTPEPGARVLVSGASGNVGPFAIQIAKSLGAEVTGVCSTAKLDLARSLGADHVIDYTTTDYARTGERYDWIVDVDSHHSLLEARRALRPGGVYVTLGGPSGRILQALVAGPVISRATGKRMGLLLWWRPFKPEDVARMGELFAAGHLRPVIDRRYPLSEVVDALRYVDDGRARGKVIVTP
jgi:NADPH:quinone reductase-like Zn-dependent oxidoreductase